MLNVKVLINEDKVDKDFHKINAKRYHVKVTYNTGIKFECLSDQQKKIVQDFRDHINQPRQKILDSPQRVIINSSAGTGKSVVAKFLKKALVERSDRDENFKFLILAFTGNAATVLDGTTIHSAFRIPTYYQPYSLPTLLAKPIDLKFKQKIKDVHAIIVDEHSLLGLRFFNFIDRFMRRCDPENQYQPFANRTVYLCGDVKQLSPIHDHCLYAQEFPHSKDEHLLKEASKVYRSFTTVYVLEKIYRQIGDNNQEFRDLLARMRVGQCIPQDLDLLSTRLHKNLCEFERERYNDVIHIFSFRKDMDSHNMLKLYEKCKDIKSIPNGPNNAQLVIGIGARVALTRNINTSMNLVNGAIGDVVDIVYNSFGRVKFILVDFGKQYKGRALAKTKRGQGIPIFQMSCQDLVDDRFISYKAFPLCLRWGATGHALQSKTVDIAAIKLGSFQFFSNMDYTMLSRVTTLSSIMLLDDHLPQNRLDYSTTRHRNAMRLSEEECERLQNLEKETC